MNVRLTDIGEDNENISLLIGSDMLARLFTPNIIELDSRVTAIETKLGWTLIGVVYDSSSTDQDATLQVVSLYVNEASISNLWRLDTLGIRDPTETKSRELELEQVRNNFIQTTSVDEMGRYEVYLPWKPDHPPLLDNYDACFKRLQRVTEKLYNENLYDAYNDVFKAWIAEGIIEKVDGSNVDRGSSYFLPHRHVIRLSSNTTPIRPVFDASAHAKGSPSLNQCLETGPNLLELIPNVLMRFRKKNVGVISDIRKAFLMISVHPNDRSYLKFLWYDVDNPNNLQVYRHCRVVFGLTCSPFLLGATLDLHLEKMLEATISSEQKSIICKLQKSFYVDNCVTSVDNQEELHKFRETATEVLASGGFDLRCWEYTGETNSSAVLGMTWDKSDDTLSLKEVPLAQSPYKITKRFILSACHKIFDCLGLVCPVLVLPKLIFRRLGSDGEWDTEVSEEDKNIFLDWYGQLHLLKTIKIPRCLLGEFSFNKSFHLFVDASANAYASVIFVRSENCLGDVQVRFVQAKSRISPKSKTSMPRLELLAATIGARLLNASLKALDCIDECDYYCWSDSTIVISWIKRHCQWGRFVWNRVQEIRQLTRSDNWYYVRSGHNPADLPSRGCDVEQLLQSKWWEGPEWLRLSRDLWPNPSVEVNEAEIDKEKVKTSQCVGLSLLSAVSEDLLYFSNYGRIVRMIGWMLRFVNRCRQKVLMSRRVQTRDSSTRTSTDSELTSDELKEAESVLLRISQKESFVGLDDSKLMNFNVFEDEKGLIRVRTPVAYKDDKYEFKYPVVLDSSHEIVLRFLRFEHCRNLHAGVQTVLNIIRERYWILRGRRALRSIKNSCAICKRHSAQQLQEVVPPLPENRVNLCKVFQVVGVDCAGPLYLKNKQKTWICLFTCAVYRAVHLELLSSLSTEVFIQAFKRFAARRGTPEVIYSDNGGNFVAAKRCLPSIQWILNPPSAPWWGGFFERLIRVIKDILRKVLRNAVVCQEELNTILCECEAIVNARPINYVSEDPNEVKPLAPSDFLFPLPRDNFDLLNSPNLSKAFCRLTKIRRNLETRFRVEYLGALKVQLARSKINSRIKIGDVVIVGDDKISKRLSWPLARVVRLVHGKDKRIRVVHLKTQKGELVRPIQRVYPLEIV